jgi:hypothetical protein
MAIPQVGILEPEVFRSVSFRADSVCSTDQAATLAEESFRPKAAKPSISQSINAILKDESQSSSPPNKCPVHSKKESGKFSKKVQSMKGMLNLK